MILLSLYGHRHHLNDFIEVISGKHAICDDILCRTPKYQSVRELLTFNTMEDIAWKCTTAFFLGVATHYFISSHLLSDGSSSSTESSSSSKSITEEASKSASVASSQSSASSSDDWEVEDSADWIPHKMVMCVRSDLKMGKGGYKMVNL